MGAHWGATDTLWEDFQHPDGQVRPLSHLHPLTFVVSLPAIKNRQSLDVSVTVGFALHTFTRDGVAGDDLRLVYPAYREDRLFDELRYRLSLSLPDIVRSLEGRKCFENPSQNYLTVELTDIDGVASEYRIFFLVQRWKEECRRTGLHCVRLIVQSAFPVNAEIPRPRASHRQPIGFRVILSRALRLGK